MLQQNDIIGQVNKFPYLGAVVTGDKRVEEEMKSAPLKLRPYVAIEIRLLLLFLPSVGMFPREFKN